MAHARPANSPQSPTAATAGRRRGRAALWLVILCTIGIEACATRPTGLVRSRGTVLGQTYINREYGLRLMVPSGWSVTPAPWYLRHTVATFQGKDNATFGKIVAFDFNPKRGLAQWEREERVCSAVRRQLYPLQEVRRRRVRVSWGEVLEVYYSQQVGRKRFIYRVWVVARPSFAVAFVCKTSDLLYEVVRPEIESVFGSIKVLGPGATLAELRAVTPITEGYLRKRLARLEEIYQRTEKVVALAKEGDAPRESVSRLGAELVGVGEQIGLARALLDDAQLQRCAQRCRSIQESLMRIGARASKLAYIIHVVRYRGETLAQMARWYAGDARKWRIIAEFNNDITPTKLRIGETIKIPLSIGLRTREPMRPPKRAVRPAKRARRRARKKRRTELEPIGPK